mmetsp:Transcript_97719/g.174088  ORF Transcript_97719/g.174088 Transcript_97719/m.174088 type:complete len:312 (-) Transcript_97719:215-1150(-)
MASLLRLSRFRPRVLTKAFDSLQLRALSDMQGAESTKQKDGQPSKAQFRAHFIQSMVPMIGFGFMDNTVMIHAGNAIDLTLGVTFGLSTMAAAACGQVCSDVAGVSFGGVIEAAARKLGLPTPGFSEMQLARADVKRVGLLGNVVGVVMGCSLGLCNLLLIDSSQKELKLAAAGGEDGGEYSVSISNTEREDTTAIVVEGPAMKGLLAAMLNALVEADCVIYELSSSPAPFGEFKTRKIQVTKNGGQIDDDDIEHVAKAVLAATKQPHKTNQLLIANQELLQEVEDLKKELDAAKAQLEKHQLRINKRNPS